MLTCDALHLRLPPDLLQSGHIAAMFLVNFDRKALPVVPDLPLRAGLPNGPPKEKVFDDVVFR